ncbi:hypothetical protein [Acinetobacter sp. YH12239]|uniref:hypothetical protein n=1 Tax=Acinetobacter sp. YH12239 TaxID=2601166 RepID=UPI0015D2DE62|nr:hypothetical protein [Acinetobacter sp. YH12239]
MKLPLSFMMLFGVGVLTHAETLPVKFTQEIEVVSQKYNADMRHFLKTLAPNTTHFSVDQTQRYCVIVGTYVDGFYQVVDKYRKDLPFSYSRMNKQDVVVKVKQSKEMQILQRYNIQCELK